MSQTCFKYCDQSRTNAFFWFIQSWHDIVDIFGNEHTQKQCFFFSKAVCYEIDPSVEMISSCRADIPNSKPFNLNFHLIQIEVGPRLLQKHKKGKSKEATIQF